MATRLSIRRLVKLCRLNVPTGNAPHHVVPAIIDNGKSFQAGALCGAGYSGARLQGLSAAQDLQPRQAPPEAPTAAAWKTPITVSSWIRPAGQCAASTTSSCSASSSITQSPYRFGQYLYVSGGDKQPNTLLQFPMAAPKADLQINPAQDGRLSPSNRTPDGCRCAHGKHGHEHSYDCLRDPALRP